MNETRQVIAELSEPQYGVVSRRQLGERGVGSRALRHQIDSGFLEPLSPQVLRLVGSPRSDDQQAMAGVLDAPGQAYLSHRSAAAWWRVPGFTLKAPIHVVIPWQGTNRRTRLTTVHYHRDLPTDHLLAIRGVPVVSPTLLIFLLAGSEPYHKTERALDNILSMRLARPAQMHNLLIRLAARGRNGIRSIRQLLAERPLDHVPPQSGLEARVQVLAKDVDVVLRRQVDVGDEQGWIGRVDFTLDDSPDVIEVLSQRYHSALLDARADADRFARITVTGRRLLTIWDTEVWQEPEKVRQQILSFWLGRSTPGEQNYAPEQSGSPKTSR